MNQHTALNILKTGCNVFLTGSAGAGKTYTLRQYIDYLKARQVTVAITASTGIAATHMDGMTIHAWSGIGIADELNPQYIKRLQQDPQARERFEHTQVLIIDEISMLHARQLNLVHQVLQLARQNTAAFGGLQVVVCGDFFQLPPVSRQQEQSRDKFAFMSEAWVAAQFQICYLTEQHRQSSGTLDEILNAIRAQAVTDTHLDQLLARTHVQKPDTAVLRLYTHNINVDEINRQQLDQLSGRLYEFAALGEGQSKLLDTLKNSVRAPHQLQLKVGAKVMFVKNNFDKGYVNGTLGEISGFIKDKEKGYLPQVKLNDGSQITAEAETWSIINEDDEVLASLSQIPLRLAWAMTIHKSQGMTVQHAEIDLSKTFEKGQGYVALSRLKTLDGLYLVGFQPQALLLDQLALKADQRFQELSLVAEQALTECDLQTCYDAFILKCGGTLDQKKIAQYRPNKLSKKSLAAPKPNTLQETRDWFELGLSIEDIADKRDMAVSTIIGHLQRLAREQQLDIERIRPEQSLLDQVRKCYKKIKKRAHEQDFNPDGTMKLRPLVTETDLSFEEIRLALLFIE